MNLFDGIEHVTIAARDPKALARWYCSTLGFKIVYEDAKSLETFVKLGESLLEIIEAKKVQRTSHGKRDPGLRHIAIRVTDIRKAYNNLTSKDVSFESEPLVEEGIWTAFFRDPEDNLPHLIQRPKPL
jgi:catechol 2,3-dioxygenase-like lactoylglutathione lyase family enzyme